MDDSSQDKLDSLAAFLSEPYLPEETQQPQHSQDQVTQYQHNADEESSEAELQPPKQEEGWPNKAELETDYSEQYQELFQHAFDDQVESSPFNASQVGSVVWLSAEKAVFFRALARKGRHDVRAISQAVSTKSEFEVRNYLLELQRAFVNRQRYSEHAKGVAFADIESAIEIGPELEHDLENAADNLATLQDAYDKNKSKIANSTLGFWNINSEVAEDINGEAQMEDESLADVEDTSPVLTPLDELHLFNLPRLLTFSRDLFMNIPSDRKHSHWEDLATELDPEPAISVDAVRDLYNLVREFVQRVMQSAMFLAESRIRASSVNGYEPSLALKEIDVVAALEVLGHATDSFEYWATFPARSGLKVFLGAHDRGNSNKQYLDADEIQNALSVRSSRGRRRSISSMLSRSSQEPLEDDLTSQNGEEMDEPNTVGDLEMDSDESEFEDADQSTTDSSENAESNHSDDIQSSISAGQKSFVSIEDVAEEEYLEAIDHNASVKEEAYLRQLLGVGQSAERSTMVDQGRRPKKRRKLETDLHDWTETELRKPWSTIPPLE